jgi:hypothetical protein
MFNSSNSMIANFVQGGVANPLSSSAGKQNPAVKDSSTSFFGDLTHFLGKAVAGGLSVASAAGSVAIPGAGLGISKLGQTLGGSLLYGLVDSTLASKSAGVDSALAASAGQAGAQNLAHQAYQFAQSSAFPKSNIRASA